MVNFSMIEQGYWRNRDMRKHVSILDGQLAPTLVLTNATYLNMYTKKWLQANIWIYKERIVYVGEKMPDNDDGTTYVDCQGQYLVPGYIEPHAHPYQLYNPEQLAHHAAIFGTTTLVNDSLMWHFLMDEKKAFSFIETCQNLPISMYWWARYDSQTILQEEDKVFDTQSVLKWIKHPAVVQGGELTAWPALLAGDDHLLYWMQETKRHRKPIEGHFPGASEKTLTKLKLLGVNADHESITGKDVLKRLELGYQVGLRYSSIRPDLPKLLEEMMELGLNTFDHLTMTTDGATPSFYEKGLMNRLIEIAIQKGIPIEEAYRMGSYNAAKHFHLEEQIGSIAPGRIAHINFLDKKYNPHPTSVLARGQWIVRHGKICTYPLQIDWSAFGIKPLDLRWNLQENDLQYSIPIGLKLTNDVITKPYAIKIDVTPEQLPIDTHDAFLTLMDKNGKWHVNTTLHGFTKRLGGLASSYSMTGDLVYIGKNKQDMILAGKRLKEMGGGIVIVHDRRVLLEIPLTLGGIMTSDKMTTLIQKQKELTAWLKEFGYLFDDPIYTILFLSSTHLPYIRITQQGIVDVMNREVLFPATMR